MTDGIIQEIINEYITAERNVKKKGYDSIYDSNEELLSILQKDLIERIKQAEKEFAENENLIPVSWLIGDNQE